MRERDGNLEIGQRLSDPELAGRIQVTVEQHDCDGFGLQLLDLGSQPVETLAFQRDSARPVPECPFFDSNPVTLGDERLGSRAAESVEPGAILSANLEDVFKTLVRDQQTAGALAFEEGVGGDGRAMLQGVPIPTFGQTPQPLEHRLFRLGWSRGKLEDRKLLAVEDDKIREGSARVDANPQHSCPVSFR